MIKLFFYNPNTPEYQTYLQALNESGLGFEPFPVTGRNVWERLNRVGINDLPACYIKDNRNSKIFIKQEIIELIRQTETREDESSDDEVPFHRRAKQTYAPPKSARKTVKKKEPSEDEEEEEETSEDEEESLSIVESGDDEVQEEDDGPIERDDGKISAAAAMKAFQEENDKLLPSEDEIRSKNKSRRKR